jgi:DNA-binding MarR family transcriptional regulator
MKGPAVLQHATRDRIYAHIRENPGVHYRGLLKQLDLPNGTLVHHLHTLERERLVRRARHGLHLRFFPSGMPPPPAPAPTPWAVPAGAMPPAGGQVSVAGFAPSEKQVAVLEHVRAHPGCSQVEVAEALGMSRQALHYHVRALVSHGLLDVSTQGRLSRLQIAAGTGPMPTPAPGSMPPAGQSPVRDVAAAASAARVPAPTCGSCGALRPAASGVDGPALACPRCGAMAGAA